MTKIVYPMMVPGMTALEKGQLLSDEAYYNAMEEYGEEFQALMGAEAIKKLLEDIDLEEEVQQLSQYITGSY